MDPSCAQQVDSGGSQRSDDSEQNSAATTSTTAILDLNGDCFCRIFDYLTFEDLLRFANVSKEANTCADFVFTNKYRITSLTFSHVKKNVNDEKFGMRAKSMAVRDFKYSLQILRCFGHLISRIEIMGNTFIDDVLAQRIMIYANKFCADSLIELACFGILESEFSVWKEPFAVVEKIDLSFCFLGQKIMQFNKWFPKMQSLKLHCTSIADYRFIVDHFPHLTDLTLSHTDKHVADVIRLNPQLKKLQLICLSEPTFLQEISQHLPHLEALAFRCEISTFPNFNGDDIKFKTLKTLDIQLHGKAKNQLAKIPILCENLDELKIYCTGVIQLDDEIIKFVSKHSGMKKIVLRGILFSNEFNQKFVDSLSSLEEFEIGFGCSSVDLVTFFLNNIKTLKKLTANIFTDALDQFKFLGDRFDKSWKWSTDKTGSAFILKRII